MTPILTALAIFFGAILLAGLVAYFVPIITQPTIGTPTAYLFHISLPRQQRVNGVLIDLPYRAAVLAQERHTQQRRLRCLVIFDNAREEQLDSHADECAAAELIYGKDVLAYAAEEAARMFAGYRAKLWQAEEMKDGDIYRELVERLPKARKRVLANRKLLEAYR